MARVTPKENFMMLSGGGHPAYVPFFTMMGDEGLNETPVKRAGPNSILPGNMFEPGGKDMWGVTYAMNETTAFAGMPAPGDFMFTDATEWSKYVKKPEIKDPGDWEAMVKADLAAIKIDRNESALIGGLMHQPFQQLVAFMGHEAALIAMYEEPEAVMELQDFMCSILEPILEKTMEYYKPDIWSLGDDTCTEISPFFNVEMYRKFFKPIYQRMAKPAIDRGIPIIFHICGQFHDFVPEMLDFGVTYIEPTQETNDIMWLKKQYPNVSFIGGYDYGRHVPPNYPNFDEALLRQDVRNTIDTYSPGGAYGMFAWPISYVGDPDIERVKRIIWDETEKYGKTVYGYTE